MTLRDFVKASRLASERYPKASLRRQEVLEDASDKDILEIEFRVLQSIILKHFGEHFFSRVNEIPYQFSHGNYHMNDYRAYAVIESALAGFINKHVNRAGGSVPEDVRQRFLTLFHSIEKGRNVSVHGVFDTGLRLTTNIIWSVLKEAETQWKDIFKAQDIPQAKWRELAASSRSIAIIMAQNKSEVNAIEKRRMLKRNFSEDPQFTDLREGVIHVVAKGTNLAPKSPDEKIEISIDPKVYENLDSENLPNARTKFRTRCSASVPNLKLGNSSISFLSATINWMLEQYESKRFHT
jgi:hypothetical protein